jgi:hypothetical protein
LLAKLAVKPQQAAHQDLWNRVWRARPSRAQVVWVNSHLTQAAFGEKFGHDQIWRWHANCAADTECGIVASALVDSSFLQQAAQRDHRYRRILEALTDRAQAILGADAANPSPMAPSRTREGNRQVKTRSKASNLCFGYVLSMPDWFEALVNGPNPQGHTWVRVSKGLQCTTCGDMLSQVRARHLLEVVAAAPCKSADPKALFPQVHATHQLVRIPHKWKCKNCCAMLRAATPVMSRVIRDACGFTQVRKGAKEVKGPVPSPAGTRGLKAFFKVAP